MGYVQALLARGDRRVGDILLAAHQHGWNRAFRESPVNPDFFTLRPRHPRNSSLGFIDHGLKKDYLREEYQRALEEKETPAPPSQGLQTLRDLRRRGRGITKSVVRGTHLKRRAPKFAPTADWLAFK